AEGFGAAGVDRDALHLTGAGRGEAGFEGDAGELAELSRQGEDIGLDAGADVERPGRGRGGGGEHRADDVGDVDVVSGLEAVAEDSRGAALAEEAAEDRDHSRLAKRVLA